MANLNMHDPTQEPSLHNDIGTFDDPIRKVGPDGTTNFHNLVSNPTEWAASETLEIATDSGRQANARGTKIKVGADALGIDDEDLSDIQLELEDEEDEADEEDLDIDDEDEEVEDEEDRLIHVNGTRKAQWGNQRN